MHTIYLKYIHTYTNMYQHKIKINFVIIQCTESLVVIVVVVVKIVVVVVIVVVAITEVLQQLL